MTKSVTPDGHMMSSIHQAPNGSITAALVPKSRKSFYHDFAESHRGSRDLIKERLSVYLPFVQPFKQTDKPPSAVDLGCGRGEWIELLQEHGFAAEGVEIDEGMLAECAELELPVIREDALEYLSRIPAETFCLVSCFHIAEHLSFHDLLRLIEDALRVLVPGGLLLIETPNPENLIVGTSAFYLDPTHIRPIPAALLSFLAKYQGFSRIHTFGLQEPFKPADKPSIDLRDIFYAVSPDYAVIAQKAGDPQFLESFDHPFAQSYGVALRDLTDHYDAGLRARFASLDHRLSKTEHTFSNIGQTLSRIADVQDRLTISTAASEREQARATLLAEQLNDTKTRIQYLEQRLEAAVAETLKTLSAASEKNEQSAVRLAKSKERIADLTRRAELAESRLSQMQAQDNDSHRRVELAESLLADGKTRFDELTRRLDQTETRFAESQAQANEYKRRLDITTALLADTQSQLAESTRRADLAESRLTYTQKEADEQTRRADLYEIRHAEAVSLVNRLTRRTQHANVLLLRAKVKLATLTERTQRADTLSADSQTRILGLSRRAELAEAELIRAHAYGAEQSRRADLAESQLAQAQSQIFNQGHDTTPSETEITELHTRIAEIEASAHHWWRSTDDLEKELATLRRSWSWRITAPARSAGRLMIKLAELAQGAATSLLRATNRLLTGVLKASVNMILARPALTNRINRSLIRVPLLHRWLLQVVRDLGFIPGSPFTKIAREPIDQQRQLGAGIENLSPHAQIIYSKLNRAIAKKIGGLE